MSEYDPNYIEEHHFYLLSVKAVIVNSKNEVLLLRRSQLSQGAGHLDLAGGGVDDKESPEDAVIREVLEETGIAVTEVKIISSSLHTGHEHPWVMLGFVAHVEHPDVTLSWEHDECQWLSFEDVLVSDLPEDYKSIVIHAQNG